MASNPISYTSRTFKTILSDINSDADLVDKPNWFKTLIAGLGDTISIWLNSVANLLFLRTAYTRQAVMDLCQLIDYYLSAQTTSNGSVWFDVDTSLGTAIFPFTLTVADLKAKSSGSLAISSLSFEAIASVTFSAVTSTFTAAYLTNSQLTVSTDFGFTGSKVRLTTTGSLPSPLQINKDYYVIYVSATKIMLALTRAQAYAGVFIALTSNGTPTNTVELYSKAVSMYQQQTLSAPVNLGTSDGITGWQEFDLPDQNVLPSTLVIAINSVPWTQVTSWASYTSSSKVYQFIQKANGTAFIRFGDGTYGQIPGAFSVMALYATGGNAVSNITALNSIVSYAGSDARIKGVSNCTTMTGGSDPESLDNAKRVAPILLKTRDRFVTTEDGEALTLQYGGLSIVQIIPNAYGVMTCKVVGIANGGGNPTGTGWPATDGLKGAIQTYLRDRSVLGSVDIRFINSTITAVAVTAAAAVKPGYFWADVLPYFRLAFKLLLTETGTELLNNFNANGIASTVTMINTYLSESFTTTSYDVITKMMQLLTPRAFGDVIQQSEVDAFVQSVVPGLDYFTIAVFGTGLPLTTGTSEITTVGTLTLSQI